MASSSPETMIADDHLSLELTVRDSDSPALDGAVSAPASRTSDEIIPLLKQNQRPRINIFSASYTRRKPREQVIKVNETEISPVTQFSSWVWSGSRYSGLLCMAFSSTLYFIMELLSDTISAQTIPLFETAFMRCTIILMLSYLWLKRIGQPIFGPVNARKLLISRALVGYLSLFSFIFSIQMLPSSQAIILSFVNPVMASVSARVVLHEKLKITDIGGLACSFFGVLFIFGPTLTVQVISEGNNVNLEGNHHIYAVLLGLFSSITGGITYCLIKAAAKASEQPVITVLSFGFVACPAAAICMFSLESLVLPSFDTLISMIVLGLLAFGAEVLLARGLELEKISKAANILYIEVVLSQLWGLSTAKVESPVHKRNKPLGHNTVYTGIINGFVGCSIRYLICTFIPVSVDGPESSIELLLSLFPILPVKPFNLGHSPWFVRLLSHFVNHFQNP